MKIAAILALLLLAAAAAPAGAEFEVVDLGALGRLNQRFYADLDGDGRTEILLVIGRTLRLYRPTESGGYDAADPVSFEVDPEALYFDVGQLDANPKALELAFVTPRGVVYHTYADGAFSAAPETLIHARSLVTAGQDDNLHWKGFLTDLDADGLPEVVLPTQRGFEVYYQRRFGEDDEEKAGAPGLWHTRPDRVIPYLIRGSLTIDPPGLTGQIRGRIEIPDFRIEDFTGDGRPDFIVDEGRALRVFACGEDGFLETEPVKELDLSPLCAPDGTLPRFVIRDLNNDEKPDFVVTRFREGITDVYLYGKPLTEPALSVKIPGWSFDARIADLNMDGLPDLVIPTTPEMDIGTALSVVVKHSITVKNHIFLNTGDPDAPYPKEPDRTRRITVALRLYVDLTGTIKAAHSVLVEYGGDFVGDERKDLVHRGESDELLFFPGESDELFAESPALTVKIPDTKDYARLETCVADLNGDGRDDLMIFYYSRDRTEDRLVLLLSRKE